MPVVVSLSLPSGLPLPVAFGLCPEPLEAPDSPLAAGLLGRGDMSASRGVRVRSRSLACSTNCALSPIGLEVELAGETMLGGAAGLRRPPAASRRFVARASRARGPERCAGGRGWKNKGKKTLGRSCPARWRSRRLAGRALFLQEAAVTRWGRFRRECGVEDDHLA